MSAKTAVEGDLRSPDLYVNRELSWLAFARRVLGLVQMEDLPLLERMKFAGIMGMLHDEFFMKRMSGLKRQMKKRSGKLSIDGRKPAEEFEACHKELVEQVRVLDELICSELKPALLDKGVPILDYADLDAEEIEGLRKYFKRSVQPILTPLAVDAEHPFPFISNLGLNLGATLPCGKTGGGERFVRIKVPGNRPRWVPIPGRAGFVPLEQVITANLDLLFPDSVLTKVFTFRVTRDAHGEREKFLDLPEEEALREPGSIVRLVSSELKARRFAGVVRLQVDRDAPNKRVKWLSQQLRIDERDVYRTRCWLGLSDLSRLDIPDRADLHLPVMQPVTHPRLSGLDPADSQAIFEQIARGDILLHHPYHSFDSSVLRFLESAAVDPGVLAIKLTIYRTSSDSPIVHALAEAARRGKQVAVLVEITARFDEAPNIAWGEYLEREGVHVAYGVDSLKTHVKLALVVREEAGEIRRYAHVGTGNYHTGTARIYEDLGLLTCQPEICDDVAAVFNELTGATAQSSHARMLVAPTTMRRRFEEMIEREAGHARAGRKSGIRTKMNQLQDPEIIRALYHASQAGVPIQLNVRGLCCLRPGVPGVSENIRMFGVIGRFLEHSRIYRFENDGSPEHYIGSADWMRRNLSKRVETITPILDKRVQKELDRILDVYDEDNCSAWDCRPDGNYVRRNAAEGEPNRAAQEIFIERAREAAGSEPPSTPVQGPRKQEALRRPGASRGSRVPSGRATI